MMPPAAASPPAAPFESSATAVFPARWRGQPRATVQRRRCTATSRGERRHRGVMNFD
jgi:hypothetical protein